MAAAWWWSPCRPKTLPLCGVRCSYTFRLFGSYISPRRQPCVRSGRRTYMPISSARMQCCSGNRAPPSSTGGCSSLWRAPQLRLPAVLRMHPAQHQPCVRSGSTQADGCCFCGVRCSCNFNLFTHASFPAPALRAQRSAGLQARWISPGRWQLLLCRALRLRLLPLLRVHPDLPTPCVCSGGQACRLAGTVWELYCSVDPAPVQGTIA